MQSDDYQLKITLNCLMHKQLNRQNRIKRKLRHKSFYLQADTFNICRDFLLPQTHNIAPIIGYEQMQMIGHACCPDARAAWCSGWRLLCDYMMIRFVIANDTHQPVQGSEQCQCIENIRVLCGCGK